jgi:hypothetical protein
MCRKTAGIITTIGIDLGKNIPEELIGTKKSVPRALSGQDHCKLELTRLTRGGCRPKSALPLAALKGKIGRNAAIVGTPAADVLSEHRIDGASVG